MRLLDLFSGIGGFSYGLEKTGFQTVAFCEMDKYCKLVLQKHWKGVKIYNDVKEITKARLDADGVEAPDIVTGGFPCQPFSVAGKQKGTNDDRHLWPEMFRIIKEFKPRWIIGENVRNIINIQDGMVFETVCTDLESEGYEVQAFNIPAAGVGAPHRRERIWIVAHSNNTRNRTPEHETNENGQKTNEGRQKQSQLKFSGHSKVMANSRRSIRRKQSTRNKESARSRAHEKTEWSCNTSEIGGPSEGAETMANTGAGRRALQKTEIPTRRNGTKHQSWWQSEPDVGRVAHGIPGRVHRLKALGNSIVPQIAEEIGRAIMKAERD